MCAFAPLPLTSERSPISLCVDFNEPLPSFDPINPLSHLMQDFYFKPELEAMLRLFWPPPMAKDIAALRPRVRARINYVTTRRAVSEPSLQPCPEPS